MSGYADMSDNFFSFSSKANVLQALSIHEDLHIPLVHAFTVEQ